MPRRYAACAAARRRPGAAMPLQRRDSEVEHLDSDTSRWIRVGESIAGPGRRCIRRRLDEAAGITRYRPVDKAPVGPSSPVMHTELACCQVASPARCRPIDEAAPVTVGGSRLSPQQPAAITTAAGSYHHSSRQLSPQQSAAITTAVGSYHQSALNYLVAAMGRGLQRAVVHHH